MVDTGHRGRGRDPHGGRIELRRNAHDHHAGEHDHPRHGPGAHHRLHCHRRWWRWNGDLSGTFSPRLATRRNDHAARLDYEP
ncbi:hypothetical protein ACFPRL_23270 [Pseudoclavibacter helvolus]